MRRPNFPLLVLSLALLAACGGGDGGGGGADDPTGPPPPPPPPPPPTALCPPGGELNLEIGEQIILRNQSPYCFNLPAATGVTEYLLGIQSVGESGVAVRNITVSGERITTAAQAPVRAVLPAPSAVGTLQISPDFFSDPRARMLLEHRTAHRGMFERMTEPTRDPSTRGRMSTLSGALRGPARAVVTGMEEVGDQVEFRVRDGASINCEETASANVLAELQVKNERSMWFVDVENPAGGFSDEQLQEMANLFDDHIYDRETAHFGVVNDKDLNERVGIVITRQINIDNGDGPQVIGFVNPCDFFTRDEQFFASNEGEFFYALAPDPDSEVGQERTTESLFDFLPVVIAHEFNHVIQFSHRFTQNGESMAIFMAEGMATLAEEMVGHSILVNETGQNLSVQVALDVDDTLSYPWYLNPWSDLIFYFGWPGFEEEVIDNVTARVPGAPEECTWTEVGDDDPCGSRPLWYGVTWSFLRWAADQFGEEFGGEPFFHQELINNNTAGFENLREVLSPFGAFEDLLAQWSAAFYMDDREGRSDPRHVVSSWDYFSADTGLKSQAWLRPHRKAFGDFSEEVKVRDPSTAYYLIGGSLAPQFSLKVEGSGGGNLGGDIQVWLVRTK